jgi:hypothetical protein
VSGHGWTLTRVRLDHPDAARLIAGVQAVYTERYGGADETPVHPAEFVALYLGAGYQPIPAFGRYRDEPGCRCVGKEIAGRKPFKS